MKKLIFLIFLCFPIFAQVFDRNGFGNDSHCELLLHFDGTNGSSVITDSSKNGATASNNGVTLDTSIKKFGTASGLFNGTTDSLTYSDRSNTQTSGCFTVEYNVKFSDTTSNKCFVSEFKDANDYSFFCEWRLSFGLRVLIVRGGSIILNLSEGSGSGYSTDSMYNIMIVVENRNVKLYKNGLLTLSGTASADITNIATPLNIGTNGNPIVESYFDGNMDELRWSSMCRQNRNHTPPNRAY